MNLNKAIEILTKWKEPETVEESEELHKARELSIEALKLVQRERLLGINPVETSLPGETEGEQNEPTKSP